MILRNIDKMNVRAKNGLYQIEIPTSYSYEEDENALAIYNETDGVGAISITSYRVPQAYVFIAKKELHDFIRSIDSTITLGDDTDDECRVDYCCKEFIDSGSRFWSVWVLYSNGCAVFLSYNCDNTDSGVERNEVIGMVRSIVHTL